MRIVVGYLRTPEGQAALDRGIEEARLRDGDLIVVHTAEDDPDEVRSYQDELDGLVARLRDEGVSVQTHEYVRGQRPGEDMIQAATEHEADLIVIGIRRRSRVGKLVLGSNAADVIQGAPCAVLSVKPTED